MAWVCSASVQESSARTTLEDDLEVHADAGRGQRADDDLDLGVVGEGVDRLVARGAGLVAADRGVLDASGLEDLLGGIHHVDVLGEEDDLAGVAGELGGVVGGQRSLGLADPPHHREDVLLRLRLGGVLELPAGDPAYELVVDAVDDRALPAGLQRLVVARHQPLGELALGLADRAGQRLVELDRQVGDPAGGDVGGDVDLAAAHDAHVDDGLPCARVEPVVDRREAGLLELGHQPGAASSRRSSRGTPRSRGSPRCR